HRIWERYAKEEKNFLKKMYIHIVLKRQLKRYEKRKVKKMDGVIAISPVDELYFRNLGVKNLMVLPIAVEVLKSSLRPNIFSIGFLGSLDWLPNLRGVEWFLKEVWQEFQAKYPEAKISLAGRNFPANLYKLPYKNIFVLGEIDNSSSFIAKQSLMIVPLFSGSGMRVKIIEAMANSKCVLTTSIGAEGILYENHKNIYIADSKEEWLKALSLFYENRNKLDEIGQEAASLVKEKYSLESHAKQLMAFLTLV
ncbi:MAG: glycosyltransferase, partial [Bacteroidetes bacterium]|nr:glycosyltransferase [Bacteroidota bacterium]